MRLPGFSDIRPPKPKRTDELVARRIAERIVKEVNLDEFYWTPDMIQERIWELQQIVMKGTRPSQLIRKCGAMFGYYDWGEEGIEDHCLHIAQDIIHEEVRRAIVDWQRKYEVEATNGNRP